MQVVGPAELASLAGLLVGALRDPHPRVRWAACHSLGVLCGDLGPGLQLAPGGGGSAMLGALAGLLAEPEGPACPQRLKVRRNGNWKRVEAHMRQDAGQRNGTGRRIGPSPAIFGYEAVNLLHTVASSPLCCASVAAPAAQATACRALVGFLEGLDAEPEEAAEAAAAATPALSEEQRKAAAAALVAPHLQPLAGPLLAAVDRCAAGEGGNLAGGRALVPTPTQEFSLDVLCRLACVLGVRGLSHGGGACQHGEWRSLVWGMASVPKQDVWLFFSASMSGTELCPAPSLPALSPLPPRPDVSDFLCAAVPSGHAACAGGAGPLCRLPCAHRHRVRFRHRGRGHRHRARAGAQPVLPIRHGCSPRTYCRSATLC